MICLGSAHCLQGALYGQRLGAVKGVGHRGAFADARRVYECKALPFRGRDLGIDGVARRSAHGTYCSRRSKGSDLRRSLGRKVSDGAWM